MPEVRAGTAPRPGPPTKKPPAAGAGGFKLAPSGRAGVRALGGLFGWPGRREAPMMRHRPDLCVGRTAAGGTTALSDAMKYPPPKCATAIEQPSRENRESS